MKNCIFCGSQMTDTAQFCNVCGNQVPQMQQQVYNQGAPQMQAQPYAAQAPAGQMQGYDQGAAQMQQQAYNQGAEPQAAPRAPKKKKSPAIIILFIVLLILIFILSFLIGKVFLKKKAAPYQKAAQDFLEAYCEGNAERAASYCIEPSKREVRSSVNATAAVRSFYGDNAKLSYEIDEINTLDAEKITELQEELSRKYDYECTISEAYLMTATFKMSAGDKTETTEDYFITLKVDGSWYIWYGYGIS